jgi:hypothetical protein
MITDDKTGSDLRHDDAQAARLREKFGEGLSFERVSIHVISKGRLQTDSSKQSEERRQRAREKGTASAIVAWFLVSSSGSSVSCSTVLAYSITKTSQKYIHSS